jgi:peroxiredoxin Q/BCP
MLKEGDKAPAFTLLDDAGKKINLSDFAGKKLVLYFYPKADTPGCTKQACALRDIHPDIREKDIEVVGVSPDPPEKLEKFRAKHNLPFPLLSDPEHKVAELYGAWGERSMYGRTFMGILRTHVAIDGDGKIMRYELKVKPASTAEMAGQIAEG